MPVNPHMHQADCRTGFVTHKHQAKIITNCFYSYMICRTGLQTPSGKKGSFTGTFTGVSPKSVIISKIVLHWFGFVNPNRAALL